MAQTKVFADRRVAMPQIILVINRVDLPPVGEEYCCNRMVCSKPSLQLYNNVKHYVGYINEPRTLETKISTQTRKSRKGNKNPTEIQQKSNPWNLTLVYQYLSQIYVSEAIIGHASISDINEGSGKRILRSYGWNKSYDRKKGPYNRNSIGYHLAWFAAGRNRVLLQPNGVFQTVYTATCTDHGHHATITPYIGLN